MPGMTTGSMLMTLQSTAAVPSMAIEPKASETEPVAENGGTGKASVCSAMLLLAPLSVQVCVPRSIVGVAVTVGVWVTVAVAVRVAVPVGVAVRVLVAVTVLVAVRVTVGVR